MDLRCRQLRLDEDERKSLIELRNNADKAYLRERASAILKIADGSLVTNIAKSGLLRARDPDTLCEWLNRYEREGIAGLYIRPGRGRKPAFSPCIH